MKMACARLVAAVVALGAANLQAISIQGEIDAAAAKGGSRVTVSGAPSPQFSIEPSPSTNGVALVYRF